VHVDDLATPALTVEVDRLDANIARMGAAWPGTRLRPHSAETIDAAARGPAGLVALSP
jgi:D-serine deaminase-like pyridoxal phosphate-dependent protein